MIGRVTGIVLAAGTSSRLGQPKQLLDFEGRPLLQHAIDAMEGSGLYDVVLVLGHRAQEIAEAVQTGPGTRTVVNDDYEQGQATSLRTGLAAADERSDAAVVILGDQPAIDGLMVRTIVETYLGTGSKVVQASFGGKPNHPTLFDRELWPELQAIEGDQGARQVLKKHPEWILRVEFGRELPSDLDTWEDYERLTGRPRDAAK
ncbi:MAG TPA: nucleotidyltransferase family protein [Actinomycetota bacterium]|nr:nucleotidyltransferase family protein [Actinomycetota bacterium]